MLHRAVTSFASISTRCTQLRSISSTAPLYFKMETYRERKAAVISKRLEQQQRLQNTNRLNLKSTHGDGYDRDSGKGKHIDVEKVEKDRNLSGIVGGREVHRTPVSALADPSSGNVGGLYPGEDQDVIGGLDAEGDTELFHRKEQVGAVHKLYESTLDSQRRMWEDTKRDMEESTLTMHERRKKATVVPFFEERKICATVPDVFLTTKELTDIRNNQFMYYNYFMFSSKDLHTMTAYFYFRDYVGRQLFLTEVAQSIAALEHERVLLQCAKDGKLVKVTLGDEKGISTQDMLIAELIETHGNRFEVEKPSEDVVPSMKKRNRAQAKFLREEVDKVQYNTMLARREAKEEAMKELKDMPAELRERRMRSMKERQEYVDMEMAMRARDAMKGELKGGLKQDNEFLPWGMTASKY